MQSVHHKWKKKSKEIFVNTQEYFKLDLNCQNASFYLTVIWFSSNKQEIDTLRMPAKTATMKYDLLCDHGQEHFHVCLSSL